MLHNTYTILRIIDPCNKFSIDKPQAKRTGFAGRKATTRGDN
uniref:Uncharacterized protein n=1 Tax=Arundo donax TaxID=35708 RepID=A0A0A9D1J7_ARUDO